LEHEIISFLALSSIKGVGFETLRKISAKGLSFSEVLNLEAKSDVSAVLRSAGAKFSDENAAPWRETRERARSRGHEILDRLSKIDGKVIFREEKQYPHQLLDLPDPPPWLFVQGDPQVLRVPSVAIVGSREPTEDGIWLSRFVGYNLVNWSCPTVSGLAIGIDQEIHAASLRAGVPTISVLGTGIFSDYPRNSERLRDEIVKNGGAIVTEYLPSDAYSAKNFVKRNRLQAALATTLIPVEWSAKSGTSHTVRYAASLLRSIACLRLPFGREPDWLNTEVAKKASIFTVPQQQREFAQFVLASVRNRRDRELQQLSLF
jgi:DNA processing protein